MLQAASLLGIQRAVIASSVSALGHAHAIKHFVFEYAPVDEAHPFAADTLVDKPTAELVSDYWPKLELRKPLRGTETAWSIDKARRLLGYQPRHHWREQCGG